MADKTFIFIGMVLTMLICLSQADEPSRADDGPPGSAIFFNEGDRPLVPNQKEKDQLNYK